MQIKYNMHQQHKRNHSQSKSVSWNNITIDKNTTLNFKQLTLCGQVEDITVRGSGCSNAYVLFNRSASQHMICGRRIHPI